MRIWLDEGISTTESTCQPIVFCYIVKICQRMPKNSAELELSYMDLFNDLSNQCCNTIQSFQYLCLNDFPAKSAASVCHQSDFLSCCFIILCRNILVWVRASTQMDGGGVHDAAVIFSKGLLDIFCQEIGSLRSPL